MSPPRWFPNGPIDNHRWYRLPPFWLSSTTALYADRFEGFLRRPSKFTLDLLAPIACNDRVLADPSHAGSGPDIGLLGRLPDALLKQITDRVNDFEIRFLVVPTDIVVSPTTPSCATGSGPRHDPLHTPSRTCPLSP